MTVVKNVKIAATAVVDAAAVSPDHHDCDRQSPGSCLDHT